jgi:hypothetical protein
MTFDINSGTQFNFTYGLGVTQDQMIGFEIAGMIWQSYLADPVTINIHVQPAAQADLGTGVIGGAIPGVINNQTYSSWRSSFINDKTSANDNLAVSNFGEDTTKFTALIDGYKIDNNRYMNINRANAKSLGLVAGNDSTLDGVIVMSDLAGSGLGWYYSQKAGSNGYASNPTSTQLDFTSVAIHEIGHILGFVSGMDQPGWLTQKVTYDNYHQSDFYANLVGALGNTNPIDLFRYSPQSVYQGGTDNSWFDLSIGNSTWKTPSNSNVANTPYISVDGGKSLIANFATGANTSLGGDGAQGSHWKFNSSTPAGIMDPQLNPGQIRNISTVDLIGMDLMGWNIKSGTQVKNTSNNALTSLTTLEARNPSAPELVNTNYQPVTWNAAQYQLQKGWTSTSSLISAAQARLPGGTANRDTDINNMVTNSQIYQWGWTGTRYWQMTGILFQTVDLPTGNFSESAVESITGNSFISEFELNSNGNNNSILPIFELPEVSFFEEESQTGVISLDNGNNFNAFPSNESNDLTTGSLEGFAIAPEAVLPGSFDNELLMAIA